MNAWRARVASLVTLRMICWQSRVLLLLLFVAWVCDLAMRWTR